MQQSSSRRTFLGRALAGAGALALMPGAGARAFETFAGQPYYDQYLNGTRRILSGLRDNETGRITAEMHTAWERTGRGGTVHSQITAGHFPTEETAPDRIGNPKVFAFLDRNAEEGAYTPLGDNDVILTNTINLNNLTAMRRGIRVVGVTVNYYPFAETPPEQGYQIEYEGRILTIETASNVVIDSQIPWYNGLVHSPRNPDFPVLPSGGFANAAVYWMCAAAFDRLRAGKGDQGPTDGARYYIDRCIERVELLAADRGKTVVIAREIADRIEAGGRWWVYGANHALVSDAVGVACGPMVTRVYNEGEVKAGDVVLIGAYTSNHPEELAIARACRGRGAYVVAIGPYSTGGDVSGPRLFKEADAAIDTYSPESWGVVPVPGREMPVCPTTGVIADIAMWLLVAAWTEEMDRRGAFPYFWKGFFMKDGRPYNDRLRPYFEARGW